MGQFKGGKGSVGGSMTFETKFDPLPTHKDLQALAAAAIREGVAGERSAVMPGQPKKARKPRKPRQPRVPRVRHRQAPAVSPLSERCHDDLLSG